ETVLPSTEESLEDDYFKEPGDSPKDLARAASAEALDNAEVLFPPLENGSELREAVKNAYVKNLQGKLTPEEALQEITEKWDASFEKTGNAPTF
ncbi:MAG TPA: sugar ABC transporter substrate-binding protein, partial [Virgibacillus sp.]|nr:sugar ABC transporter substrate-binding protein [Virgibacillus sp.]